MKTCASFAQPTTSFIVCPSCSFSRLTTILQHGISFFALSGEGSHCTLVTFHMLQQATTLGYSLVACTPCLYCQATQPCGFKIEIATQSFKKQEKWRKYQSKPSPNKEYIQYFHKINPQRVWQVSHLYIKLLLNWTYPGSPLSQLFCSCVYSLRAFSTWQRVPLTLFQWYLCIQKPLTINIRANIHMFTWLFI